jgi:hypothetical protein
MKLPPCKDCEERYPACHDKCEKYKDWKGDVLKKKKAIADANYELHTGRVKWSPAKKRKLLKR